MGGLIVILLLLWGVPHCIRHPRQRRHTSPPGRQQHTQTAATEREIERRRKAETARRLAVEELDHRRELARKYREQFDALEEAETDATGKTLEQVRRQIAALDERMFKNDARMAALYDAIN